MVAMFAISLTLISISPAASIQKAPIEKALTNAKDIRFLTHNLSKSAFMGEDGLLHGHPHAGRRAFYVETVMAMMAELGHPSLIQEVSLNRGFFLLENETNYAFFNLIKNEDRKARYKWVGPISVFPTYYYELKARPTGVQTLDDTKKVRAICVLKGNNVVKLLFSMGHTNILEAHSNEACARLLRYGRVSLITGSEYPWFTGEPELADIFTRTPVTLSIDEGFIAFSKSVPDAVIDAWQQALNTIKKNGIYESTRQKFLVPTKFKKQIKRPAQRRKRITGPKPGH